MAQNEGLRVTDKALVVSLLPDVCLTPPMMLPIPYTILARFSDGVRFATSVRMTSQHVMTTASRLPVVHGDEPGTGGGICSGVNKGWCRSITHSKNVRARGNNVTFNTSYYWMNCDGPDGMGNTIGVAIYLRVTDCVRVSSDGEILGDTNPPPTRGNGHDPSAMAVAAPKVGVESPFPKVKYDLDLLPPIESPPIFTPNAIIFNTLQLKGELSLQREGADGPISISNEGYEVEASNTLNQFTSGFTTAVDPDGTNPRISSKFTGPFGGSEVGFQPPSTFTYKTTPRAVEGTLNGWKISGEMSTELKTTVIPLPRAPPSWVPYTFPVVPAEALELEEAGGVVVEILEGLEVLWPLVLVL